MKSETRLKFKRQPRLTGLAGVANPHPSVDIKLKNKVVGTIVPPSAFDGENWSVGVMVDIPSTSGCGWRWVYFKAEHASEQAARDWVTKNSTQIVARFHLRPE